MELFDIIIVVATTISMAVSAIVMSRLLSQRVRERARESVEKERKLMNQITELKGELEATKRQEVG